MTPPRRPLIERVLRRLVRLLPEDFRDEFGGSIEADIAERRAAGDRAGLIRRDLPSLLGAIGREHFSTLRQDIKYSLRMMRRTPGFTALAVLMLALGTGVNVAMFSIVDAVMLRSPFKDPDRIVHLSAIAADGRTVALEPRAFEALASRATPEPFDAIAALWGGAHILMIAGEPHGPDVECVSASMFDVLGTRPLLGRTLAAFDDRPEATPAVVLGFNLWKRLGGSPSIVGTAVTLNQTQVTVVGVMPKGFAGAMSRSDTEAWLPLFRPIVGGGLNGCTVGRTVTVYARLHDGVTPAAAEARLPGYTLHTLDEEMFEEFGQALVVLVGAVACVLLIACFNVGGLQMERMLARRREMAVRTALGATRWRLVRQTSTEHFLLAAMGSALGVFFTWITLRTIISVLPANTPHLDEVALNGRAFAATIAVAVVSGLIAGVLPMRLTRQKRPGDDLSAGTRSSDRVGGWTRKGLVLAEVALSIVVMVAAGLMLRTFATLRPANPGFDASNKVMLQVRVTNSSAAERARFYDRLFERLRTAPGIRDLAGTTYLPMRAVATSVPLKYGTTTATINTAAVTPDYFSLMKIPVVAGRSFTPSDTAGSSPVAIVNELLARRIRPDGRVLGERIFVWNQERPGPPIDEREIVGVIANTRSMPSHTRPWNEAYVPFAQHPRVSMLVIAATDGSNDEAVGRQLRAAVRELRPDLVLQEPEPLMTTVNRGVRFWRSRAWLLGAFAGLAILLSSIGLMTTMGWWVHQRTRELGVRMALGATRGGIARLVFRQGLSLASLGVAAGLGAASLVTKYVQMSLYGVTPLDPATFIVCGVLMLVVSAAAMYVPVRRATSVDPVVALRAD